MSRSLFLAQKDGLIAMGVLTLQGQIGGSDHWVGDRPDLRYWVDRRLVPLPIGSRRWKNHARPTFGLSADFYPQHPSSDRSFNLIVAHQYLIIVFGIWPAFVFARWIRRRRRYRKGACPSCGYNLTGNTSGKCPECGGAIE